MAQELKYHLACMVELYNRERAHLRTLTQEQGQETVSGHEVYALAFSELVTYTMETFVSWDTTPAIFQPADLARLYKQHIELSGLKSLYVSSSRLKES